MGKRSYNQMCPLAYALDIVGERWTLLIIRELLFGPRRFKDLFKALPGIGTNLLADRLKELESERLIVKTTLPPPAGSMVYQLTHHGRALTPAIKQLAAWGISRIKHAEHDDYVSPVAAMAGLTMLYRRESGPGAGPKLSVEIQSAEEVFGIALGDEDIQVATGHSSEAQLVLRGDLKLLLMLLGKPEDVEPAVMSQRLVVKKGDLFIAKEFVSRFWSLEEAEAVNMPNI